MRPTPRNQQHRRPPRDPGARSHAYPRAFIVEGGVSDSGWQTIETAPEGVLVDTKIDDARGVRNEQPLIRNAGLWWISDGSMYVYFTPSHWKMRAAPPGQVR